MKKRINIHKQFKEDFSLFKEKIKELKGDEKKQEIEKFKEEKKQEMEKHFEEVKSIVDKNTEAGAAFLKKIWELKEKHHNFKKQTQERKTEYRGQAQERKTEYRTKKMELKIKYKKVFVLKLTKRLDSISDDKLEKISKIIEGRIKKIEENTRISDSKKEKILAQYEAIKEIINERLDSSEDEEVNLDELFN